MKKTTLVLAISALLYGASSTYVVADELDINAILSQIEAQMANEPAEPAENDPVPDDGQGTDPFTLPDNVTVDDSVPIKRTAMCETSFQVDGGVMAEFPVTVTLIRNGVETVETVMWTAGDTELGYALGPNGDWLLIQYGDTWYKQDPWFVLTLENVAIKQILLEPIKRKGKESYAFDIGGKELLTDGAPQHTPGAANGRPIGRKTPPSPNVRFTAVYSNPVFTNAHNLVQTDPPGPHDLYGTLKIDFNKPVSGTEALGYIGFAFVADTDCLPVQEITNISYVGTTLNFTVTGEGAVAIMDNAQKLVQGPFMVERGTGQATFTTQFIPTAGTCYNMMDVDTLKVMTQNYCF